MTRKSKNIKTEQSGFLRYRKGEMSGSERNAFERDLQKDPFAEEASEGFEHLTPDEMEKDLSMLAGRVQFRVKRKKNFVLYRIAASVAVLMIVSSIFIIVERNNSKSPAALTEQQQVPFTIARSEPIVPEPEASDQAQRSTERPGEKKNPVVSADEQLSEKRSEKAVQNIQRQEDIHKEEAPSQAPEERIPEKPVSAERSAIAEEAPASMPAGAAVEKSLRKSEPELRITGQVLSTEDSMPLPGATVTIKGTGEGTVTDSNGNFSLKFPEKEKVTLVAGSIGMKTVELPATAHKPVEIMLQPDVASLNEVVVTGYGVRSKRDESSASYKPPQPAIGKTEYNRYIEANIQRPDSANSGQRAVVVARFPVLADGTIGSINILRTPGEEFSREAIRLISSGPAWNPALRDGVPVQDSVTLRIVFK